MWCTVRVLGREYEFPGGGVGADRRTKPSDGLVGPMGSEPRDKSERKILPTSHAHLLCIVVDDVHAEEAVTVGMTDHVR